jgi:dTDP-4-dehydrorhamnose 3,5-epimerase
VTEVRQLSVSGAWEFTPPVFADERGTFAETYSQALFAETAGHPLVVAQVNTSVSRRGTLRGLHYSVAPEGQAKYVTCLAGSVLDVAVDLRVGSPTFGVVDSVVLDDVRRSSVYLPEGVGHAFLALSDTATVTYLCSTPYAPEYELAISPLDPSLAFPWPADLAPYVLSPRDATAPSLHEARTAGGLPAGSL